MCCCDVVYNSILIKVFMKILMRIIVIEYQNVNCWYLCDIFLNVVSVLVVTECMRVIYLPCFRIYNYVQVKSCSGLSDVVIYTQYYEYQEFSCSKEGLARKADNLTAICELII
jgi:hypothetical protein